MLRPGGPLRRSLTAARVDGLPRFNRRRRPIVEIAPFRGLRYDPSRVDPNAVIAPPYDVVGEDDVAALQARSPWNIARVESPRGDDGRFEEAAEALRSWEAEGVLLRDSAPVLYAYEQRTRLEGDDGPRRVRRGYFARLRLSPFEAGEVLPHERTMAGPKAERLALLQATRTNVSPILVISSGDTDTASALLAEVAAREPSFAATDGRGDEHRLWVIDDPAEIARLVEAAAAAPVLIADGHHRYETALGHLEDRDEEGRRWMLACLVPENDPGLDILPTHRLVPDVDLAADFVERLDELYVVEPLASRVSDAANPADGGAARRLWEQVQAEASQPGTFGLIGLPGGGLHVLRPRSPEAIDAQLPADWSEASRALDVQILNQAILEPLLGIDAAELRAGRVQFSEDAGHAWEWVRGGSNRLAFLVNPPRIDQVIAVAGSGDVLPQKATYFYPKLATGMVLNRLD